MTQSSFSRLKRHQDGKKTLHQITDRAEHAFLIHYSCESFHAKKNGSPRITSIAIRNLSSGQTRSFSVYQIAEEMGFLGSITQNFDGIEKKLLKNYFAFVKASPKSIWIHWNMRDVNFGFQALEHRASVLGVVPFRIDESRLYDLARILIDIYGKNYIQNPKMESLVDKNKIAKFDFLSGSEEADCFTNHEFRRLHLSTLRKVDIFESFISRASEDSLKVDVNYFSVRGLSPSAISESLKNNWLWVLLLTVIAVIALVSDIHSLIQWFL
ncbi:MAG: hypothetical protein EOP04_13215 [Proteobacteria bacterium]|nr:MAG: hypothetical protein EOP04_13215 [Pseudomonadota bacterium]